MRISADLENRKNLKSILSFHSMPSRNQNQGSASGDCCSRALYSCWISSPESHLKCKQSCLCELFGSWGLCGSWQLLGSVSWRASDLGSLCASRCFLSAAWSSDPSLKVCVEKSYRHFIRWHWWSVGRGCVWWGRANPCTKSRVEGSQKQE